MTYSPISAFIHPTTGVWVVHPQGATPLYNSTTALAWKYFPRLHLLTDSELNGSFHEFQTLASVARVAFECCKTQQWPFPLEQTQVCQRVIEDNLRWIRSFQNLHLFLKTYRAFLSAQKRDIYLRPQETGFIRPIQITQNGAVLIHYTKRKENDPLVGRGASKTVKFALELGSIRTYTTAGYRYVLTQNEYRFLKEFKGVKGFIQMHSHVQYFRKGKLKNRVIFEYCWWGTLQERIKDLLASQRKTIFTQLIQLIAFIHKKGILHRDLKKANIFLDENAEPVLGDLGAMCTVDDQESRKHHCTSRNEVSPEYARAVLGRSKTALIEATTVLLDSWSLACILYELLQMQPTLPWLRFEQETDVHQCLAKLPKNWLAEPKDKHSAEYLVWRMFQHRLTAEKAEAQLNQIHWPCPKQ